MEFRELSVTASSIHPAAAVRAEQLLERQINPVSETVVRSLSIMAFGGIKRTCKRSSEAPLPPKPRIELRGGHAVVAQCRSSSAK